MSTPRSKLIINLLAAAKLPDGTGGTNISGVVIGGFIDTQGNFHTIEGYQLPTCEDNGTGTLKNFTRIFVCTDRFKLPGQ